MARMRFAVLVAALVLAGTVPLIAVVSHRRARGKHEPDFSTAVPTSHSLMLYNPDGYRVAWCDREDANHPLRNCHVEDGYDVNDVMNAWLKAYEDR